MAVENKTTTGTGGIVNKEFDKIDVTIHYIDEKLDTGDVLLKKNLCLSKVDNIYELRYHTTILATKMVIEILNKFSSQNKRIDGLKQVKLGKYFSAMNLDEKYKALNNFLDYKMDVHNG